MSLPSPVVNFHDNVLKLQGSVMPYFMAQDSKNDELSQNGDAVK
eukprot:CAMPEP_0178808748 /NCGR_PEP_ID=MMETSP0745-20121128/17708_1 /TAXON_ID=913974 /ORGANISM="Nitzschia punctata, Strain CCMP561" /LENGTH=43 /DNA_ID= /DNA_START= /DNA_END= /DNA_ORIENTATION=